ncbi:MAG: DUF499 domain-containing protein [Saprospiraceae bacterium]|nr:MAG: DUF499 domain-containing protein [Saprospiraceae bacterium]
MKNLQELLRPRQSVFDKSRRDVVLDITDLTEGKIDPATFFAENYITQGMKALYQAVFKRLEGKSDDGVFKLTQTMGGGKTHNMIAVGLLAKHPEFRQKVMKEVYETTFQEQAKVIGFTGRENPRYGIWGHIAEQLGKRDLFKEYYDPLEAPGQSAWINLLKGEKVVILLDELPPYFQAAKAKQIGNSDLAVVTTQALSNLLVAIGKEELKNVVLIISDLTANYAEGSEMISQMLDNYGAEVNRVAKNFTPVQQTGDEIYHILRTKLFQNSADPSEVDGIAGAYATTINEARKMNITTETPERFAAAVKDSFPFHPAVKDLYARFKENPGFMQTRGLIRFMRTVVSRMWDEKDGWADKISLIAPHDIDLNDSNTLTEIASINSSLTNAISHDIAGNPPAVAENLDDVLGNDMATKTAKLILMASLATVQNSIRGLKDTEIIRNLCAPGVNISEIQSKVLSELKSNCWYLHLDNAGNFLFKNVQNVVAKLKDYVSGYTDEGIEPEIRKKLEEVFNPEDRDCYQKVFALTSLDGISIDASQVALVIYKPYPGGKIHPDLQKLYDDATWRNRMMFLTGDAHSMEAIYQNVKALKGIEAIIGEFASEKMPKNDPQFIEAEKLRENFLFKFRSAVTTAFVKLYYPTKNGLLDANFQMQFTNNDYRGEKQIVETLKEKRKFTEDVTSDTFVKYVEGKLFGTQKSLPWRDIKSKAAQSPDWLWHKPNALDQLKEEMLHKDLWRANGDWIEKGPFPPPKTSVAIRELERNDDTGEVKLKIIPTHGDTIHYEIGDSQVTTASSTLDIQDPFLTKDLKLSFLCVDSKGRHETGEPEHWQNRITLKHRFYQDGNRQMLELQAAPRATIKYTTDGSDPLTAGGVYESPVEIPDGVKIVVAAAEKQGIRSETKTIRVPEKTAGGAAVDKSLPAIWKKRLKKESTAEVFEWLNWMKKHELQLSEITLAIEDDNWILLETSPMQKFDHPQLSKMLTFLQEMLAGGKLKLEAGKLHFKTGQHFTDYVRDTRENFKIEDIEQ